MSVPNDPIEIQLRTSLTEGAPVAADEAKWQMIEGRIIHAETRRRGLIAGSATMAMVVAIAAVIVVSNHAGSRSGLAGAPSSGNRSAASLATGGESTTIALAGNSAVQSNSLPKYVPKVVPAGFVLTGVYAESGTSVTQLTPPGATLFLQDDSQPIDQRKAVQITLSAERTLPELGTPTTIAGRPANISHAGKDQTLVNVLTNDETFLMTVSSIGMSDTDLDTLLRTITTSNTSHGPALNHGDISGLGLTDVAADVVAASTAQGESWSLNYGDPAQGSAGLSFRAQPSSTQAFYFQLLQRRLFGQTSAIVDAHTLSSVAVPEGMTAFVITESSAPVGASVEIHLLIDGLSVVMFGSGPVDSISAYTRSAFSIVPTTQDAWAALYSQVTEPNYAASTPPATIVATIALGSGTGSLKADGTANESIVCFEFSATTNHLADGSSNCTPSNFSPSEALVPGGSAMVYGTGLVIYGFATNNVSKIHATFDAGKPIDIPVGADVVSHTKLRPYLALLPPTAHWFDLEASDTTGTRHSIIKHHGSGTEFPTTAAVEKFNAGKVTVISSGTAENKKWTAGYALVDTIDGAKMLCHRLEVDGQSAWDNCHARERQPLEPLAYETVRGGGLTFVVATAANWVQRVELQEPSGKIVGTTDVAHIAGGLPVVVIPITTTTDMSLHAIDRNGVDSGPMGPFSAGNFNAAATTALGASVTNAGG